MLTHISNLPSPSTSACTSLWGSLPAPVEKSTAVEKLLVEKPPLLELFLKTETDVPYLLATEISSFPSPSTSAREILYGFVFVLKLTLESKLLEEMLPLEEIFLYTDIVLSAKFDTTISTLPSKSKSAIAISEGVLPVENSTFASKLLEEMAPLLALFLKTDTELST